MKYKLILLKDLPGISAGEEVLNVKKKWLDSKDDKFDIKFDKKAEKIYQLRHDKEWVKVEEDNRCDCKTYDGADCYYQYLGYGMYAYTKIDFKNKQIFCHADWECDTGSNGTIPIKYCPFCGEKL